MISRQAPHLIHIPSGVLIRFSPSSFLRNSRIAIVGSPHRLFEGLNEPPEGRRPPPRRPVTLHHPDAGAPDDRGVGVGSGGGRPGGGGKTQPPPAPETGSPPSPPPPPPPRGG